jgi:hypothetical protein
MMKKNTTKRGKERESIGRISVHANQAEKKILTDGEHMKYSRRKEKKRARIFFIFDSKEIIQI